MWEGARMLSLDTLPSVSMPSPTWKLTKPFTLGFIVMID